MDVILSPVETKEKQSVEKLREYLSEAYLAVWKQSHSKALDPFANALSITEKIGNENGEPSTANFLHNVVYVDYALSLYLDYLNAQAGEASAEKNESEDDNDEEGKSGSQETGEDEKHNDQDKVEEGDEDTKDKSEQDDTTSGSTLEQAKEFFILAKQFFEQYTVKPEIPYWNSRLNNCTICQVCKYIAEIAFLQGNAEEALCAARLAATRAQDHLQDMPVFLFGLLFDCLMYMIALPARKLEQGALSTATAASVLLQKLSDTDDPKLAELRKDFEECKKHIQIILRDNNGDMSDDFISGSLNNMLFAKDKRVFQKWTVTQQPSGIQQSSENENEMEEEDSETVIKEPSGTVEAKSVSPPSDSNPVNMIQHLVRRKRKDPEVPQLIAVDPDVVAISDDEKKMASPAKKIKM